MRKQVQRSKGGVLPLSQVDGALPLTTTLPVLFQPINLPAVGLSSASNEHHRRVEATPRRRSALTSKGMTSINTGKGKCLNRVVPSFNTKFEQTTSSHLSMGNSWQGE